MNSLYDASVHQEVTDRLNRLTPASQGLWGKMSVSQMLAHCKEAFRVPLSDKPMKRSFIGYIFGPLIKKKLYNEDPWKKNLPTAPQFKIKDERDFEQEKKELTELIDKFYNLGPGKTGLYPHPMFGTYTKEQWGKAMYKHLDHHLQQFGV